MSIGLSLTRERRYGEGRQRLMDSGLKERKKQFTEEKPDEQRKLIKPNSRSKLRPQSSKAWLILACFQMVNM